MVDICEAGGTGEMSSEQKELAFQSEWNGASVLNDFVPFWIEKYFSNAISGLDFVEFYRAARINGSLGIVDE